VRVDETVGVRVHPTIPIGCRRMYVGAVRVRLGFGVRLPAVVVAGSGRMVMLVRLRERMPVVVVVRVRVVVAGRGWRLVVRVRGLGGVVAAAGVRGSGQALLTRVSPGERGRRTFGRAMGCPQVDPQGAGLAHRRSDEDEEVDAEDR